MTDEEYAEKQKPLGNKVVGGDMVGLTVVVEFEDGQELFYPEQKESGCYLMGITLNEILEQAQAHFKRKVYTILVISEFGVHGYIYKYGNHGDYWEEYGETVGYA